MLKIKKLIVFVLLFILILQSSNSLAAEPTIYSPAAILIDINTGKVLYEKNSYEKRYPASLTKIMTAILAIENCELSEVTTVSYNAVMSITSGYITANLQIGEELTIEQLLNLTLIASSNDAAICLAEHVSRKCRKFFSINE